MCVLPQPGMLGRGAALFPISVGGHNPLKNIEFFVLLKLFSDFWPELGLR